MKRNLLILPALLLLISCEKQGPGTASPKQPDQVPSNGTPVEHKTDSITELPHVVIRGDLLDTSVETVRLAAERVMDTGASWLILVVDSPGGSLGAAWEIEEIIIKLQKNGVRVAAYIDSRSEARGARGISSFLALCCDRIFMAPNTLLSSGPVLPYSEREAVRRKLSDAIRERYMAAAKRNGHSSSLASNLGTPGSYKLDQEQAVVAGLANLCGNLDAVRAQLLKAPR